MYRKKIPVRRVLARPIVTLMLRTKFGDETLFAPNRAFYERAGVSCQRFQRMAQGYAQPTQEEIVRISRALNMKPEEMLKLQDATQLDLFE
jgi:plasmid maintenance system antidote protein VapI